MEAEGACGKNCLVHRGRLDACAVQREWPRDDASLAGGRKREGMNGGHSWPLQIHMYIHMYMNDNFIDQLFVIDQLLIIDLQNNCNKYPKINYVINNN